MKKYLYSLIISFIALFFFYDNNVQALTSIKHQQTELQNSSEDTVFRSEYITICRYDLPYFYSNNLYTEGGEYEIALQTSEGKDSIITLYLTVVNIPQRPEKIMGDSIMNEVGNHTYINEPIEYATEYKRYMSNLYWIITNSNNMDTATVFIPSGGSGTLSVTAANECGISAATQLEIKSTLRIEAYLNENEISLYPNPTIDYITLTIPNISIGINELSLFDIHGKLLKTEVITNKTTTLNLSNLPKGIYFLKVKESNRAIKTFKIGKD
jgi:hypothetical protein